MEELVKHENRDKCRIAAVSNKCCTVRILNAARKHIETSEEGKHLIIEILDRKLDCMKPIEEE